MKTDTRHYLGWGARLRLVGRIVGITALLAALGGFFLLAAIFHEVSLGHLKNSLTQASGAAFVAALLVVAGGAIAGLILLLEIMSALGGSGQRSASGVNASVQIVLALGVFAALNYLSFDYFKRWDLTRDRQFTLPENVVTDLRKLEGKTTIVVLQRHKLFGQSSEGREADDYDYDAAAERKITEKVRDLVDQFRLVGPQFRVVILNYGSPEYDPLLQAESEKRPGLRDVIAAAPEDSIFFYADDRVETIPKNEADRRTAAGRRVQTLPMPNDANNVLAYEGNIPRLSFNEFYQLDKTASKAANPGPDGKPQGNLILRPQGIEAFARRVLAIQEKRPKVGLLVVHEVLTSAPASAALDRYTSAGLRQSLEAHGFDVVDIVLKKWGQAGGPTPAAYTLGETQFDRLEAELDTLDEERRDLSDTRKGGEDFLNDLKNLPMDELRNRYGRRFRVSEEWRKTNLPLIAEQLKQIDERITEIEQDRTETDAQLTALLKNERAFEDRRVTDVKAKLSRLVADCDLIILPRLTLFSAPDLDFIRPKAYELADPQTEVVRDFMKAGKPVLACVGPNAERKDASVVARERDNPPPYELLDSMERLLSERGVLPGRETIISFAESKAFAARRGGAEFGGAPTEIPPVTFPPADNGRDNPVAAAMRATEASVARPLEIRIQDPRPIYVEPAAEAKQPFPATFLRSSPLVWNEENPMVVRRVGPVEVVQPPRFRPTLPDDPRKGTSQEVKKGPFPIGVAIEGPAPVEWYDPDPDAAKKPGRFAAYRVTGAFATPFDAGISAAALAVWEKQSPDFAAQRKSSRLAVIGHGGLFTGKQLSPAQEQLLLQTSNWLLKRDDLMPRTDGQWEYPRVTRDERTGFLWKYGPFVGLPAFFLYVGLIVWIVRRVR